LGASKSWSCIQSPRLGGSFIQHFVQKKKEFRLAVAFSARAFSRNPTLRFSSQTRGQFRPLASVLIQKCPLARL
jgi:hypothetical protein